jgi:S-sulfo-L-cysteine synthase (O-acetyl-L-serine-dependent)
MMLHVIGNTPLLPFDSLSTATTSVFAKAEWRQLGGSVKARAAFAIIRNAIKNGDLNSDLYILDASSGNTAIAYGEICKKLGLGITICLPENASQRRIEVLRDLGVEIVFTSPFEGTEGAQLKAMELYAASPDKYFYADQYNNPDNWKAHYNTSAVEILNQTEHRITHFVAGLGTTGTFTGTARRLKEEIGCMCIALQPDSAMHIMEGWKHLETAQTPGIFDNRLPDEVISVSSEDAVDMMRDIEKISGLRLSPSSAANLVGAKIVADQLSEGVVVTMLPDSIERYHELETEIFE